MNPHTAARLRQLVNKERPTPAPGPFAPMQRAILRAVQPPPRPLCEGQLPDVPHDSARDISRAEAKRERRRQRNARLAHG
jgi:hypothetical protein